MAGSRSPMLSCIAMVVVVVAMVMSSGAWLQGAEAACPSTAQLYNACSKYVLGSNPPVPAPSSSCCSVLKSSSASCLCSSLPSNARNIISSKGIANIRSSCKINVSC